MSLKNLVGGIWLSKVFDVHSVPATYGAGAQNIFAITGGLVLIRAIIEHLDTALGGATTTQILVGAVGMDAGLVAINAGGINSVVVSPMNAAIAKIASALAVPLPSLLSGAAFSGIGVVAAQGVNIIWTFGGAAMGALERVSLHVLYQKIEPAALIA